MDHTRPEYYLAAPFDWRAEAGQAAEMISAVSGWDCTSTWLDCDHDGAADLAGVGEQAEADLRDLRAADALVVWLPRPSTKGGLWVEMGHALALDMPVIVAPATGVQLTVFCAAPIVRIVPTLDMAAECLRTARAVGRHRAARAAGVLRAEAAKPHHRGAAAAWVERAAPVVAVEPPSVVAAAEDSGLVTVKKDAERWQQRRMAEIEASMERRHREETEIAERRRSETIVSDTPGREAIVSGDRRAEA